MQNYTPTPFHVKLNGCTLHFHAATITHIVEKTPNKMKTVSVQGGEHNDLILVQKILAHVYPLLTVTCRWFHNLAHSAFETWLLMIPNLLSVGFVCASLIKILVLSLNPECLQCNLVCLVWSAAFSPSNNKKKNHAAAIKTKQKHTRTCQLHNTTQMYLCTIHQIRRCFNLFSWRPLRL